MPPLSSAVAERSRKTQTTVLQRLASVGQNNVAEQLQVSESTVSRFVSVDLERACQVFASLGLKVVPQEMQCFEPRKVEIFMELARDHLNHLQNVQQLSFED